MKKLIDGNVEVFLKQNIEVKQVIFRFFCLERVVLKINKN